jgi:phosphatidylglycerol lysyltransferase
LKNFLRVIAGPLLILCILIAALWMLAIELRHYHLRDFLRGLSEIPTGQIVAASLLTVLNYVILIGYDLIGIRYIQQPMPFRRVALASFLGYAVGNNFGTLLGGATIRYRLYTAWGLSSVDIIKLVFIVGWSFWIGVFALAGVSFILDPLTIDPQLHLPLRSTVPLGILFGSLAVGYLLLCAVRRRPIRFRNWEFVLPPPGLAMLQIGIAALDLFVAAAVLYVLMPSSISVGYLQFVSIFLFALVASLITQVPGGLAVLELIVVKSLNAPQPERVFVSLLAFRLIYFVIPLLMGLLALSLNELRLQRHHAGKVAAVLGQWSRFVAPRLLAFAVFVAGIILLFSGATPDTPGRIQLLKKFLPLPVIEVSHILGSVVGGLLLLLARSLQRRVETAYYLTVTLLIFGIVISLTKGFDYEEAMILSLMLAIFLPCRREFYRKGALFTDRFSVRWFVAIALVVSCTLDTSW